MLKMKIKFKDSINSELTCIGLRPGMFTSVDDVNNATGAAYFKHWHNGSVHDCVVWPEDYELIETPSITIPISQIVFCKKNENEITLPIAELTNVLDAMHWVFSPYLEHDELSDKPWITNLMKSYNDIVSVLPSPWDLQYEPVDY